MKNTEIAIRAAVPEDVPALLEIYAPYVTDTAVTFEYEIPTREEFTRRMETVLARYPWLVAERNGELLGYAYLSPFHARAAYGWCAETSIYLRRDCRGQGLGRLLYQRLEDCAKAQGILNLEACIAVPEGEDEHLSLDSPRFHEKLGYRMVGSFSRCGYKFGTWYGMCWMEKLIGAHGTPRPVQLFPQVRGELGL